MDSSLRQVSRSMRSADNYADWKVAAEAHDELSGAQEWRKSSESNLFDHRAIRNRLDRFRLLKTRKDYGGLLFSLNEGVHGNIDGIGHPKLYGKAKAGTKKLIEDYVDDVVDSLELLHSLGQEDVDQAAVTGFFKRARHCFGSTALMLSGGGILGNFHMGVVKTLWEEDFLPDVISGASAGAIVAAIVGTHTREDLLHRFDNRHLMKSAQREANWFERMRGANSRMEQDDLRKFINELIPDLTFEEARRLSGRHINISISPAEIHQKSRLLNATTAPHVLIRPAVLASAAVPGVFPPVALAARKEKGELQPYLENRRWVDGSVSEDLPAKRLSRLYGVNHFIVSQTNPMVLPFLEGPKLVGRAGQLLYGAAANLARESLRLTRDMSSPYAHRWPRVAMGFNTFYSVALQNYRGDINILPDYRFVAPRKLLSIAREEEIIALEKAGERSTWPQLEAIRVTTHVSRTLDRLLADREESSVGNNA